MTPTSRRVRISFAFALIASALPISTAALDRPAMIEWDLSNLSGAIETDGQPPIMSRHVMHPDNRRATEYIADRLKRMGWNPQQESFGIQTATIDALAWREGALVVVCEDKQYRWESDRWIKDEGAPRLSPGNDTDLRRPPPSPVRSEKPNRRIVNYTRHPQQGWVALARTAHNRWGARWETLWWGDDGVLHQVGRVPNKSVLRHLAISETGWAVAGDWGSVLVSHDEGRGWRWLPPPDGRLKASNVVVEWPGATDSWIMIVAHFDSTATADPGYDPETDPAPGADDNAAAAAILLDLAEWAAQHRDRGNAPKTGIRWVFANAEEIGLVGSFHDAQRLSDLSESVEWVLNLDQVGSSPGNDRKLWVFHSDTTQTLAWRLEELGYRIPSTPLVLSPYPVDRHALSDHYAYAAAGWQTLYITGGAPLGPHYHRASDTFDHVDLPMSADLADCLKILIATETGLPERIWPVEASRDTGDSKKAGWPQLAWALPLSLGMFYAIWMLRLKKERIKRI